ncbi:MAG TPA: hypothetical protein VF857_01645 [Spirochaetota bacterium]
MNDDKKTYHNLIDVVLTLEEKGMKTDEVFRSVLIDYFFRKQSSEKKFLSFMKGFDFPTFIQVAPSLLELDADQFSEYVQGSTPVDSLAGKILLTKQYLKIFHPDYPPEFKKVPGDIQIDLVDEVKEMNEGLLSAFAKMADDREADRKRTLLTLVALIIKNVHLKNGVALAQIKSPATGIIRDIFADADDIFRATALQHTELTDDLKIKSLIKSFCIVRKTSDMAQIASFFKEEYSRYRMRAVAAFKEE